MRKNKDLKRESESERPRRALGHDAEKYERFSGDIMLSLFNLEQDSDFRPTRPKSSCSGNIAGNLSAAWSRKGRSPLQRRASFQTRKGRCNTLNCDMRGVEKRRRRTT
ncbi:hypothetical protein ACS4RR_022440 [Rhizobium sp. Z1P35]